MPAIHPAEKIGNVFQNPVPTKMVTASMLNTLWKYMTVKAERVPKKQLGPFHTNASIYNTPPASGLRITWMGHSSLLIEIDGYRILTDPVWGERASFVSWAGPKRFFPAPLPLNELPHLDAIILSHDHYDHLDRPTIKQLTSIKTPFYCSLGVGHYLKKWGILQSQITEMNWGDTANVTNDLSITTTPARHFSGRGIINRNTTLWSSFVIKGSRHNIFFGADSGWFPGFNDIGAAYGPFDLTMLEIGAYNENWADIHMGPENATKAHIALKGKVMMPIHWGTFNLALHDWREPVELLQQYATEKDITLFLPMPGIPTEVTPAGHNSMWWDK